MGGIGTDRIGVDSSRAQTILDSTNYKQYDFPSLPTSFMFLHFVSFIALLSFYYKSLLLPETRLTPSSSSPQTATTLTTNDIVINKLTQILSYLRQGRHGRRLKKKDRQRAAAEEKKVASEDIYGELGDYVPAPAKKDRERDREERGERR